MPTLFTFFLMQNISLSMTRLKYERNCHIDLAGKSLCLGSTYNPAPSCISLATFLSIKVLSHTLKTMVSKHSLQNCLCLTIFGILPLNLNNNNGYHSYSRNFYIFVHLNQQYPTFSDKIYVQFLKVEYFHFCLFAFGNEFLFVFLKNATL